jgi:hypothetical protein
MMRKPPCGFCLLGVAMTSLLGCEAVPTLFFPGADAAAGSTDGPDDAEDGAFEVGCPQHPPPGASACCNAVPCNGDCDAGCPQCEVKCSKMAGTVCCARNTVTCRPFQSACN